MTVCCWILSLWSLYNWSTWYRPWSTPGQEVWRSSTSVRSSYASSDRYSGHSSWRSGRDSWGCPCGCSWGIRRKRDRSSSSGKIATSLIPRMIDKFYPRRHPTSHMIIWREKTTKLRGNKRTNWETKDRRRQITQTNDILAVTFCNFKISLV